MSNCYVNIRFGCWHLQVTKSWRPRISYNDFHQGWPEGFFAVYDFFGNWR